MNTRARIERLERSIKPRIHADPDHIAGAYEFLKSGDTARIPDGVSFPELQAAARRIPPKTAGKCAGLSMLREALAETLKGRDILGFLEEGRPFAQKCFHVESDKQRPEWPAGALLKRLGFEMLLIDVVNTRERAADA